MQNKARRDRAGQRLSKISGSTGRATGCDFKDRLKRQNEVMEVEWAPLSSFHTGNRKAPERLSQMLCRAYAAKQLFVCHLLLLSVLWEKKKKKKEKAIFISKAQLLQNNTEAAHEGFDRLT